MKALVEKDRLVKKQEKEMRKAPHFFFMYIYQGNSRDFKKTPGNSREHKGTQGNSKKPGFVMGSARRSS